MRRNLEAQFYTDPALFARERTAIFRAHWHLLGPASQVASPGQYVAAELAGDKLFVLRGKDGVLRAFRNVCPHRGGRLLEEGAGSCEVLRCPYHLWLFDETGRLRRTPWFGDDPEFRTQDWPLTPAHVAEWRGLLFASIAPAVSLDDQLGDLPEEVADYPLETYSAVASREFVMQSNWKTYTDNFVEGYHVPGIHPSFAAVIEMDGFETVARNNLVRMTAPQKGGSIYGGKWLWMWPNWTLSVFPGGMNTSRIDPLSVDRTALFYHFYFADTSGAAAAARERTIETNCAIVREDFGICEHTQRNLASGLYAPGPLSPRQEQGVAWFQDRVASALAAPVP